MDSATTLDKKDCAKRLLAHVHRTWSVAIERYPAVGGELQSTSKHAMDITSPM